VSLQQALAAARAFQLARRGAAGSYPLPLRERVAAISAFTRVSDALWRRGEGVQRARSYPTKAPLTPTLSHSASKTRVNALMLRSRLWHASRCARGEGAHRVRGTALPNRNQAYSIRAECALIATAQDIPAVAQSASADPPATRGWGFNLAGADMSAGPIVRWLTTLRAVT
jgi:hypothetical protein